MRKRKVQVKTLFVLLGTLVAVASVLLSAASAKPQRPAGQPADAVLIWNANAVKAVRASTPTKVQTDGMVYMSYVQAAVYDAVTKLEGRYAPYHDFAFVVVPDASVQTVRRPPTTLDYYLPDQQPTVDGEYNTYISTLSGDVADGVALGEAAAHDLIAFRAGNRLNAATPSYGGIGPILPGQWQLQPGQAVQTPWLATMRPFFLEQASQFRVGPPPALTSEQYAKDLNETKAYGALNSSVRTPEQTAIAYFWVGNNINQYNQTMQNVVAQHDLDLVDAAHLLAMGEIVTTDAGIACFDSKFFYQLWRPITAIRNADKDGNPDTTAQPVLAVAAWGAGPSRVPVPAWLLHCRVHRRARGSAQHQSPRCHHAGRREREQRAHDHTAFRHGRRYPEPGRRRTGLARLPLPQLGETGRELGNNVAAWELRRFFHRLVAGLQGSGCVRRVGAAPVGAPVGNELVGRRSRVVHGEDPHARRGVRIIRFRPTRNATYAGLPTPGRCGPHRLVQPVCRVWRAGAGDDRVNASRITRQRAGRVEHKHAHGPRRLHTSTDN